MLRLAGGALDLGGARWCGDRHQLSREACLGRVRPGLRRFGVHGESLRSCDARDVRRERPRRLRGQRYQRLPAPKIACAERSGEARGAARGQHVVGAGGVVAEGRAARAARGTRSRWRAPRSASALGVRAGQLEVLGRDRVREVDGRVEVVGAHERERRVLHRRRAAPRCRAASLLHRVEQRGARRGHARRGVSGPCSAWAARSSATTPRVGARRRRSRAARSGPRSRRCRPARRPGAWPPARRRCPGPTITSTGVDRGGAVGERGDRLRAAHQVDLVARRRARRPRGSRGLALAVGPGRRGDRDLLDAGDARRHAAHHHRGGIRGAPAGHVRARAPHRQLAERRPTGPAVISTRQVAARPRPARARSTFAIAASSPTRTSASSSSSAACDAAPPARGTARAPPRCRSAA